MIASTWVAATGQRPCHRPGPPLPWHPLRGGQRPVPVDSAPGQTARALAPALALAVRPRQCGPGRVAPHLWGWRVKWHSGTGLASPGLDRNWQGTGPSVLLLPQQVNKERGEAEQGPEVQGLPQLFR